MPLSYRVCKLQIALFLSTLDLTDRLAVAMAIRESSGGLLNGEPLILPLPGDAPAGIPRLRIGDTDGKWTYQITLNRIDCSYEPSRLEGLEDSVNAHFGLSVSVWRRLQEEFAAASHRVGFVSQLETRTEDAPSVVRETFLRTGCFGDAHRLEVHALHKMETGDYSVNRWVRLRAVPPSSESDGEGRIGMEVDINTLPDAPQDLSAEALRDFLENALDLLRETAASFTAPMVGEEEDDSALSY